MGAASVISAWSAVSPFGLEQADFVTGVGTRQYPAGPVAPAAEARLVPGFDIREVLGRKGTRSLDRATALAVTATGRLLRDAGGGIGEETAVVLGTTTGSAQSIMDFTRDSLTQEQPYYVDPARFPNTVLNCAAARSAIWYQLRGPNATVAGGHAAGLLALNYARRLQRSGRAEAVLCGAVDEVSTARSLLSHHAGSAAVPGEGCAMLLLEPAGRPGTFERRELAEVAALSFGVAASSFGVAASPDGSRQVLAGCIRRALAGRDPWAVVMSTVDERAAVADAVGDRVPVRLCVSDLVGDTDGAASAFAVAALLALAGSAPAEHDRTALVTAADRDGTVGCAVLRLRGNGTDR